MRNHKVSHKVQNLTLTKVKISKISRSLLRLFLWFCSPQISENQSVGFMIHIMFQLAQQLLKNLPLLIPTFSRRISALIFKKKISNLIQITWKLSIKIIAALTSARQCTPTSIVFARWLLFKAFSRIRPSALKIHKESSTFSKNF